MNWSDIVNAARVASPDELLGLQCPRCGGPLRIEYVELPKRSALYIDCVDCGETARSSGEKTEPPPWVKDLGTVATTTRREVER